MVFLAASGSRRRRRRNFVAQELVQAAYFSSSLVTYTLGSMQSSPVKSSMYPFWAASLYILSRSADYITAYSLDDNSHGRTQRIYHSVLSMIYVVLIAATILTNDYGILLFIDMVLIGFTKWVQRDMACRMASGSWNLDKMVSDYMQQEHTGRGVSYDPVSMRGYHYLVDWPLRKSKLEAGTLYATQLTTKANQVIDIERIWQCESLSSEQRDACLSFSLFHLLRRRFFGFICAESPQKKTHDFVFKGLLAKNERGAIDYGRVFKVIDVELAFMYDFFFTKHAFTYYESRIASAMFSFMLVMLALMLATIAVSHGSLASFLHVRNWSTVATTTTTDIAVTLLMLASITLLEVLQLLLYWKTIWGTALRSSRKFSRFFGSVHLNTIHPDINYRIQRSAGKLGKPVELSAQVKEALVQSLESTQGVLTNGQSSLRSNGADDPLWACRLDNMHQDSGTGSSEQKKNQAHFILTWHIATCYCEGLEKMTYPSPTIGGDLKQRHLDIATKLAKYCAYLVVSEPKLLPGHHYDTQRVFEAVVEEAIEFLQSDSRDTCESKEGIFHNSVRLGKQLEGMEQGARWKVLADFWAEMLLYLAPSDNVKAHVECLANGGELITHLWALLTHAGILERGQKIAINDTESAGG
ncbi:unnamed protein product [Urochloa decumbens]|uniref:DUF4220 domain-containing protein n=1 Tax=Urochloa decumbens TaxID=240449 RepID=A0ABC9FKU2_9POAL